MNKVNIVYYSFTGNTLRMVKAFEKGLQDANVPFKSYSVVELKDDNEAFDCEILALASPANQTEEIEKNSIVLIIFLKIILQYLKLKL